MPLIGPVRRREFKWHETWLLKTCLSGTGISALRSRPAMVFLVWAIVLVCVSIGELLPGNSQPIALLSSANISDKVLHASAYALLALVPAFGFRLPAALCFAFATELIGIALEFAQLGVPERSYEPSDMLANTVGVLLGWAVGRGLGVLLDMGYSNDPDTWEQVSHRHDACETELICQDNQG